MTTVRLLIILLLTLSCTSFVQAAEPTWTGPIVKRGSDRAVTQRKPIEQRPYRPLHFYGNTRRRIHYRGQLLPRPHDVQYGAKAFILNR